VAVAWCIDCASSIQPPCHLQQNRQAVYNGGILRSNGCFSRLVFYVSSETPHELRDAQKGFLSVRKPAERRDMFSKVLLLCNGLIVIFLLLFNITSTVEQIGVELMDDG
jgi:hypothetical protein